MYTEDFLHDDPAFDEEIDISVETSTIDSEKLERKKNQEIYRLNDPDYYSFKRYEPTPDNKLILKKVRVYSSPYNGYIRNPPTGIYEKHRVGSKSEDLYFTVKDLVYRTDDKCKKLFFRNPEEFERLFKIELPTSIKQKWNEKNSIAKRTLHN
jgi:hypothetical protein